MTDTNTLRREAMEALAGTTEGPWWFDNNDGYGSNNVHAQHGDDIGAYEVVAGIHGDSAEAEANAHFIAASRTLVPQLVAALEAAEADLARVTAERDAARAGEDELATTAAPYISPVQNGDFARQIRQHDALCAALATYAKHKEGRG